MLEVIDKGPALESDKTPLLFVHGAWHGAWCWDEHLLDYFAAKGCRSLAVNVSKFVLEMLWLNLPLGAEDDIVFTQREVRATAAAYHTEAEIYPRMAHDMMLEPGWAAVAERIHAWLETRCPTTLPQ
jgi:pimeloyl-ACP methyl ester carboxylesterase